MALISKLTIQEVNSRLDAISIVNDYVRLEKKSGRWWGRCPFHAGGQEKTPSFTVDPDLKLYHCFGCGTGGNVINFVMEMDKITYPEAIKSLAQKLGIEVSYEDGSPGEEGDASLKEQLFELYRRTTLTFEHFLNEKPDGKEALEYLQKRGFSKDLTGRFNIGFSPADRDFLYGFLKSKSYSDGFLEKSGLFSSRYKTVPLFSGRLMFPIKDRQGRVVAFGGRVMPGVLQKDGSEPPKYINSPETEIYKKGQNLYALDLALPLIRQNKTVFLAEGYMDVIALHQAGVTNAVAPLGTSFTDEQAAVLRRFAEKVILVFDTDQAGEKAAYKAIIACRKNGLSCAIAVLQQIIPVESKPEQGGDFKDPADILQKFGPKILNNIVNCTINDTEYLISRSKTMFKADGGGKNRAAEFLFPYLDALDSEIERDSCTALIADSIGVDRNAVQRDYSKWKTGRQSRQFVHDKVESGDALRGKPIEMNAELRLLAVVAVNMALYPEFRLSVEIKEIDDLPAKELFIAMEECFTHDESDFDSLLSRIQNQKLREFIAGRAASEEFKGNNASRLMEEGINKVIVKKRLIYKRNEITALMRSNERMGLGTDIDELLAEKKSIDAQIRKIEGR